MKQSGIREVVINVDIRGEGKDPAFQGKRATCGKIRGPGNSEALAEKRISFYLSL